MAEEKEEKVKDEEATTAAERKNKGRSDKQGCVDLLEEKEKKTTSSNRTLIIDGEPLYWECLAPGCGYKVALKDPNRATKKYRHSNFVCGERKLKPRSQCGKMRGLVDGSEYASRGHLYRAIWNGKCKGTKGGIRKKHLKINARGKIVSIAKSRSATQNGKNKGFLARFGAWFRATKEVRAEMGITGKLLPKKKGNDIQRAFYHNIKARVHAMSNKFRMTF